MKRNILIIVIVLLGASSTGTALATPLYYSVGATITNIYNSTGLPYDEKLNDQLQYVFEIDFDRQGQQTNKEGNTFYLSGHFFTDLLVGDLISPIEGKGFMPDDSWQELNYGRFLFNKNFPQYLEFDVGGNGSILYLNLYSNTMENYLHYYDTESNYTSDQFSLAINNVETSQTNPVSPIPEPTTISLLGIGIMGLIGSQYRERRKIS